MRRTDLAKVEFNAAKSALVSASPENPFAVHHLHMARGMVELATAVADIYDKLQVIDRKLSGAGGGSGEAPTRATLQTR